MRPHIEAHRQTSGGLSTERVAQRAQCRRQPSRAAWAVRRQRFGALREGALRAGRIAAHQPLHLDDESAVPVERRAISDAAPITPKPMQADLTALRTSRRSSATRDFDDQTAARITPGSDVHADAFQRSGGSRDDDQVSLAGSIIAIDLAAGGTAPRRSTKTRFHVGANSGGDARVSERGDPAMSSSRCRYRNG